MLYLILSTTLFMVMLLAIEIVKTFFIQHHNYIFTIISMVLICTMVFINGILKGKNDISEQTVNVIYLISVIIYFIVYACIHNIKTI